MWSLIYCICLLVMGLGAVAALMPPDPEESPLLRIGLGMSLGPGIGGLGLIGFSMLGRLPSAVLIFFLTAPFAILLCVYRSRFFRRGKISWGWIKGRFGWLNIICLVAIAYGVGVSIHYAVADGVIMGDAFAIWMLKAKVLATQALYPRPDYFTDVSLSFSHLRYPILVPMIGAGVHAMSGRLEGDLVSAPFLLSYFGLVMAVFGAVRSWGNWTSGLAAAAMFMTTPLALCAGGQWDGGHDADGVFRLQPDLDIEMEKIAPGRRSHSGHDFYGVHGLDEERGGGDGGGEYSAGADIRADAPAIEGAGVWGGGDFDVFAVVFLRSAFAAHG